MVIPMMRSGLQASLRRGARTASSKRSFASSAQHDDAYEAEKWEKITYVGVAVCTILAIYNLSKRHPHYEEPPPYPYLHIRNKEFPWGDHSLFEKKHKDH
ncbi:cytochrome c oxidase subunit 6a, mitochondrial-like [Macadamia integrifolia]|uniref:cytochrome c oxidase subunit 6a, mitochondrial-like n=1 Tax=Macadamia integrifolia TaxID=60698 RepID=UPI001C501056|nr:cytochrome c oxidase subunit 6a, mitochondrial-like [Macadamia integrifolia]XP_042493243.1 cytochrome c oxidase subunit 6a, mitochondrial-like [Macadamia integrifolia]XP_042493244.1 cytochrome c oxidase subunit 6a, mitochondrial-like [Macadamia integrifolia]